VPFFHVDLRPACGGPGDFVLRLHAATLCPAVKPPYKQAAANASAAEPDHATVRDPLASSAATRAARARPMSERLELALSWNAVAAELRAGLLAATRHTNPGR
jgi:hypothetical protein